MKNQYLVTAEGLEKLKSELELRENVKRVDIKKTLEEMRAQGDLRENDGYTLATEDFKSNESEILRLKELITNAKIVKAVRKDTIEIGDSVTVSDKDGSIKTFKIGGTNESDPGQNIISNSSPLGKALIGKKVGDSVKVITPRGSIEYTVKEV
ncbi:transcription elongation factor GreA [Candidatus Dojkabacteria bacterium]|nr:transcription elongation factor GreA [Candidatus Dojkabacteria bacterium]